MRSTSSTESGTSPRERTKSNRGHIVPLSDLAIEIIKKIRPCALAPQPGQTYQATSPYAFPSPKKPNQPMKWFSKSKGRVAAASNVSDWGLHDLRRTATTGFGIFRIDYKVKQKILNHANGNVTDIYDQFEYFEQCFEAMHRWAQYVRKIITGEIKETHTVRRNPYVNGDKNLPDTSSQPVQTGALLNGHANLPSSSLSET